MIAIEKRHFRSKQDFHLELYPIGNLIRFHVRATSGERNIGSHIDDTSSIGTERIECMKNYFKVQLAPMHKY